MLLAVVDTHFPTLFSGFRYWENLEFHKIDDNVLFFSVNKMNDPFPAEVHPLSDAIKYPITDIYCVFLNHTLGLLDCALEIPGKVNYGLSDFIRRNEISIHSTIYAGGGYEDVTHPSQVVKGLAFLRDHQNVKTVFTNLGDVQRIIPKKSYRITSLVNTSFFEYVPRVKSKKLQLLFAAHPPCTREQKGFNFLVDAFNSLDSSKFHLHVVGDWKNEVKRIKNDNFTYYGTLFPNELKKLFYKCHVIVNPPYKVKVPFLRSLISSHTDFIPIHSRFIPRGLVYASVDTFPLAVSAEAMSTGCCLISTNHRQDHVVLTPGEDYLEIREKSSEDLANAIEYLYKNQDEMLSIAFRGHEKVLNYLDTKKSVAEKYAIIKGKQ
jgi:glycosyltransferase involved in cell wall biosynthesis